jgi:uncharacterized protein YyaL (SSP411 family)
MSDSQQVTNHLIHETSPYLLQHARNPVDWFPWGPEALEKARREDKPIFLSIGYSACHWCHVMEHESFEDPGTAALMNEHFVNIKVDREERPDLDHIYMAAVQMMTRHGGWPMSVFLTPDLEPFYGGTYFPPEPRHGMPSFKQILAGVSDAWHNRRDEITRSAGGLAAALEQMNQLTTVPNAAPSLQLIDRGVGMLERDFDPGYGGFGSAPKFPHPMDIRLCLRHWKRTSSEQSLEMATRTLDHMARGGIYDQLGGGFHRYSTDERWLVPHFEKMLYDNALLTQTYLEAFQATRQPEYEQTVRETLDYILREMTAPNGGFYSTQDADSEGVEGKFFVWSLAEVQGVLGPEAFEPFAYVYDVTAEGNWEHTNILNRPKTLEQCARLLSMEPEKLRHSLQQSRAKLFDVRARRVAPGRDEKVLVAWNGLMIDAMARAYQVLGAEKYLGAARQAADFIIQHLWKPANEATTASEGSDQTAKKADAGSSLNYRLRHSYKDGRARFNAYLDDYAAFIDSLVTLYESTFDPGWLRVALEMAQVMIDQFWDEAGSSFFYTPRDHERLITRVRDVHDSATPSGNSLAVTALLRLGRLTERSDLTGKAERTLNSFAGLMSQAPRASGQMLIAVDSMLHQPIEIVIACPPGNAASEERLEVLRIVRSAFLPGKVVTVTPAVTVHSGGHKSGDRDRSEGQIELEQLVPLVRDKTAVDNRVTAYICQNYACQAPVSGVDRIRQALERLSQSGSN